MLLAIDPSTKSTGWSVFEGGKPIDYGCITASSSNLYRRIDKIIKGIEEVFSKYPNINVIALEDPLPSDVKNNRKVYKALMYLQGFLMYTFDAHKVTDITFYYPSEWRAKCAIKNGRGIKRESEKAYDIAFIKETYNIEVNDDVADALAIGYAHTVANPAPIILEGGFELG